MVEAVDENPCAEWLASVKLGHEYDQSSVNMAVVPPLSPRPTKPAHPSETAVTVVPPMSAELAEAAEAVVAPPEAKPRQWQHDVLQS